MTRRTRNIGALAVGAVVGLFSGGCGRTIEEDEPPELVEHRVEPCRTWCSAQLDPECGARPEDLAFPTVEECVESCATAEPGGWEWARQEDGTDACAEEWTAAAECMSSKSCVERRSYFRRSSSDWDYPCKEELTAQRLCWDSTPNVEKEDG